GRLQGWLMTICRSIWLNEVRSRQVRKAGGLDSSEALALADGKPDVETNIFASEVFTRVMGLPEAQRSVVELVYVQELTYSEAAKVLDVPIGTVMSRLFVARKALKAFRDGDQTRRGERG
ncbi:MAG: sigma factor-like helix-turn-helix DNA-binding protein, partial [Pseudomonadota bacterium]